ncbi:MAG TPA: TIGR03435 family protein, partial [Candidatus Sulfopaludibacter sp.]|nr:TIGR03435 family protein [Candidatus Sulfopaludibacter sp.]
MRNVPLRYALEWAYDLKDYEISGPEWIKVDERFDIIAKASGPATDDQMRPMLQALLLERLQMKVHRETRELNVYVLGPGKGVPKVNRAAADEQPHIASGPNGASFLGFPISRLTFLLSRRLDRPVLDRTGLDGNYDYAIDLSGLPGPRDSPDNPAPSIFTTVQRDMGLKLEPRKEPISILVIDQVSKIPTAN